MPVMPQSVVEGNLITARDRGIRILAVDTSTSTASAALVIDEKVISESVFCTERTLSSRLIPEIERLVSLSGLNLTDVDLFAASIGPGSFTGVRGGVATLQGLALAADKPCYGFSSLAVLAMNFSLSTYPVCALLDARKNEVYAGLYDCSGAIPAVVIPDRVMPPIALLELIASTTDKSPVFTGDGALRYCNEIMSVFGDNALIAPFQLHNARAVNGALLALDGYRRSKTVAPSQLLPVYLRASDAEINRKSRMV
jgi:tRNA threonylcarbamoyladenosine biosynthesis protein TsaB